MHANQLFFQDNFIPETFKYSLFLNLFFKMIWAHNMSL